jgi:hypothetical protein
MTLRGHLTLLSQAIAAWVAFWVLGLPAYYQQYSTQALAIACVFLSVAISLAAIETLRARSRRTRHARAFWLSLYFTVPFAILDAWYCGMYLGHGTSYLWKYWYLTVFYATPWLTFMATAALLGRVEKPTARA